MLAENRKEFDTLTAIFGRTYPRGIRIPALDVARGLALIAMTTFHFSWDLEFFGYAEPGMTSAFAWKWYAHGIAFTFLTLAGISFALAHGNGIRRHAFVRRLLQIGAAAAVISLATWIATPNAFVFFGILHQIALASVIALLFVRMPAFLILIAAAVFLALPTLFRSAVFDAPLFWWTGLAETLPRSNDYVPVFPWTGAVLLGLSIGKFVLDSGASTKLGAITNAERQPAHLLSFLGRHSLAYYLIHQPVLFGLLYVTSHIAPPDRSAAYMQACVKSCVPTSTELFCRSFCGCVQQTLESKGIFAEVLDGKRDVASDPEILETASLCTAKAAGE